MADTLKFPFHLDPQTGGVAVTEQGTDQAVAEAIAQTCVVTIGEDYFTGWYGIPDPTHTPGIQPEDVQLCLSEAGYRNVRITGVDIEPVDDRHIIADVQWELT